MYVVGIYRSVDRYGSYNLPTPVFEQRHTVINDTNILVNLATEFWRKFNLVFVGRHKVKMVML